MLDRIYKGVLAKIKAKGTFSYKMFEYAVDYRTLWLERGYDTPLFDKFLFRAVRDVTGGRLAKIIVGGAPLSGTTHQFVRSVRHCPDQGNQGGPRPLHNENNCVFNNAELRLTAVVLCGALEPPAPLVRQTCSVLSVLSVLSGSESNR